MTPASRLPVNPGEKVLDLCAAPGGKATELGSRLRGEGLLVANDISASRAKALLKNVDGATERPPPHSNNHFLSRVSLSDGTAPYAQTFPC